MRLFVANVGVNTADARSRGLKSPVFDEGRFEFVPIKEPSRFAGSTHVRRYRDLPCWTREGVALTTFLPKDVRDFAAHDDPDFVGLTYGDIASSRAATLTELEPGDHLWFLARLWSYRDGGYTGPSAFHFVGALDVTDNLALQDGLEGVDTAVRARAERNAHWLRYRSGDSAPSRILAGDVKTSARFERAIQVTPDVAGLLFGGDRHVDGTYRRNGVVLRNKCGTARTFETFGSITRTVQWFLDSTREEDRPFLDALGRLRRGAGAASPPLGRPS